MNMVAKNRILSVIIFFMFGFPRLLNYRVKRFQEPPNRQIHTPTDYQRLPHPLIINQYRPLVWIVQRHLYYIRRIVKNNMQVFSVSSRANLNARNGHDL